MTRFAALLLIAIGTCSASELVVPTYDLTGVDDSVAAGIESTVAQLRKQYHPQIDAKDAAGLYGALGQLFHAFGLLGQASESYHRAAHLDPGDGRWPYLDAVLKSDSGQPQAAMAALRQALAAAPDYAPAIVRLAGVLRETGDSDTAGLVLSRLPAGAADPPENRAALAEHFLATEQPRKAIELLETVITEVPHATRLNYLLGQAYRAIGERKQSRRWLARSGEIGLAPADPWLAEVQTLARGEVLALQAGQRAFNAGDYAAAVDAFERALAAEPQSVRARVNLAAALAESGAAQAAIQRLEEALALAPDNETALFNLAELRAANGELEAADLLFQRLLQRRPDDMQAHLQRARVLQQAGMPALAVEHARRARSAVATYRPAVLLESELLVALGRSDDALAIISDAHAIFPADAPIALTRANLLATAPGGDAAEALSLAQQVNDHAPTSASAEAVALALAALNRCEESSRWLTEAAERAGRPDRGRLEAMSRAVAGQADCRPVPASH